MPKVKALALVLAGLLPMISLAKLKPEKNPRPLESDCVYQGKFKSLEIIKVRDKELEPVSLSVGRFLVSKLKEAKSKNCSKTVTEFDVIFSNGYGKGQAWGEACAKPFKIMEEYEISLNIQFEGTLMPADCYRWIKRLDVN